MRNFKLWFYLSFISLFCGIVMLATGEPQGKQAPSKETAAVVGPSKGQLLLRLPYRGPTTKPLSNPYQVSLFITFHPFIGDVEGTDVSGNVYVIDPTIGEYVMLKRFDRHGKFAEAWEPITALDGERVVVTKGGHIWTGLTVDDYRKGLPIVIYRSGQKEPVVDWRDKLPEPLDEKVKKAFAAQGGLRTRFWQLISMAGAAIRS